MFAIYVHALLKDYVVNPRKLITTLLKGTVFTKKFLHTNYYPKSITDQSQTHIVGTGAGAYVKLKDRLRCLFSLNYRTNTPSACVLRYVCGTSSVVLSCGQTCLWYLVA